MIYERCLRAKNEGLVRREAWKVLDCSSWDNLVAYWEILDCSQCGFRSFNGCVAAQIEVAADTLEIEQ